MPDDGVSSTTPQYSPPNHDSVADQMGQTTPVIQAKDNGNCRWRNGGHFLSGWHRAKW
jgi:hypothetical protein